MKHLIITGFDGFGGESINPSWEAVRRLPDQAGSYRLTRIQIPTVFEQAALSVLTAAAADPADVILCVGGAAGRDAVTPELMGINWNHARIPDNAGQQPLEQFIEPDGPAARFATVPVSAMARAIRQSGFRGAVSHTAGAYVCNDTLYRLLRHYDGSAVRVGFIHVPAFAQMELEQTIGALLSAIGALDE